MRMTGHFNDKELLGVEDRGDDRKVGDYRNHYVMNHLRNINGFRGNYVVYCTSVVGARLYTLHYSVGEESAPKS